MCSWFRQSDEIASPRVSREKLAELARRLKVFSFAGPPTQRVPALDD
jgi:hypothetical protein